MNYGEIRFIYDANGNIVTTYLYDAWGTPIDISGSLYDTVGRINPFRYKSYYYDSETMLYYLQSRCYDPQVGRFLNADIIIGDTKNPCYNLFAYCLNNPICAEDKYGLASIPWLSLRFPGEIHLVVVGHLFKVHGYDIEITTPKAIGTGRIDVVQRLPKELFDYAYEVKPVTYKWGYRLLAAVDQLDEYCFFSNNAYIPGPPIPSCEFYYRDFWVTYWSEGQGIILYSFRHLTEKEKKARDKDDDKDGKCMKEHKEREPSRLGGVVNSILRDVSLVIAGTAASVLVGMVVADYMSRGVPCQPKVQVIKT